TARGDVSIEARPSDSNEEWYDVQTVLEMVTGAVPRLLDAQSATFVVAEMESAHHKVAAFFTCERSDRTSKYALWVEGSYWGSVLRTRAAREALRTSKRWWRFW